MSVRPEPRTVQPAPPTDLGTIRELWHLLWRRKFTVIIVFVVVTGTVVAGSMMLPPNYTATTAIMIKHGREFFYRAQVGDPTERPVFNLQEMVNSEVEILASRDLAEKVVEEMGIERLYPDMLEAPDADPVALGPAAVSRFQDTLTVLDVLESGIIRVSYENRDREVAAEALNRLIEHFKEKHLEVFADPNLGFMTEQLNEFERRLVESENALEKFRRSQGVYDLPTQKTMMLQRRMQLDGELDTAAFRIAELQQTMQMLNGFGVAQQTWDPPPPVTEDRASLVDRRGRLAANLQEAELLLAELRKKLVVLRERAAEGPAPQPGFEQFRSLDEAFIRLLDLQLREQELLRNYNEDSRQVTGIRQEMEQVQAFLRDRGAYVREILEARHLDEIDGLMARREKALDQIETVDQQIRDVDLRLVLDELTPLQARSARVREEQVAIDERLAELEHVEKDLRRLERAVTLNEANYQAFLTRSENARMLDELDQRKAVNIAVIERATPPVKPSSLSPKLRAVIGAAVGLFAGLAAAVFMELVSR